MPTYSISKSQIDGWNLVFAKNNKWHPTTKSANFYYGNSVTPNTTSDNDNDSDRSDRSTHQMIPFKKNLKYFHEKYYFFKALMNKNLSCVPETYFTFDDFLTHKKNDNSIWFYKLSAYDCGSGVTPFLDNKTDVKKQYDEINNGCKCKKCKRNKYVIQKGVKNLMLYDGRKFDIRIHILITPKGDVYVYKNACIRISFKKYSSICGCKKHQLTNGSLGADVKYASEWDEWKDVYPNIKKSIIDILMVLKKYVEKNKYVLIGGDFILDVNRKAWVLEFNTYPNLFYKEDPQMQPTITHMLKNMLDILMTGKSKNRDNLYSWDHILNIYNDIE